MPNINETKLVPVWITTKDNPYDPFEEWNSWFAFDFQMGYNTPGLVARLSYVSTEMSDADYHEGLERAIDNIIENVDPLNMYKKVYKNEEINE